VISLAIPVSIVASSSPWRAGRTLNVISLAGIAFAVGMVVDAAIVVLENIYRLRQQGYPAPARPIEGAQVWGAILVSALTTVMVFIPILVMELEAGQLFRDIAVAISVSVMLSLVVASRSSRRSAIVACWRDADAALKPMPLPVIDHFGRAFSWLVMRLRADGAQPALGARLVAAHRRGAIWAASPSCRSSNTCPRATATSSSASSSRRRATTSTTTAPSPSGSRAWRDRSGRRTSTPKSRRR
jgi:HAE1 family hydrophobic/amphiphilic exporter-1